MADAAILYLDLAGRHRARPRKGVELENQEKPLVSICSSCPIQCPMSNVPPDHRRNAASIHRFLLRARVSTPSAAIW